MRTLMAVGALLGLFFMVASTVEAEDPVEVKTFRLKYASPEKAFSFMDSLKSDVGQIIVDELTGTVVIKDRAENIAQMQKALDELDREMPMLAFVFDNYDCKSAREHLIGLFVSGKNA